MTFAELTVTEQERLKAKSNRRFVRKVFTRIFGRSAVWVGVPEGEWLQTCAGIIATNPLTRNNGKTLQERARTTLFYAVLCHNAVVHDGKVYFDRQKGRSA